MKFGMIFSKKDRLCKKNAYILRRDVEIYILYIHFNTRGNRNELSKDQ